MSGSITLTEFYCFQITGQFEIGSTNQFICLEYEGQLILESRVLSFDSYIHLMQQHFVCFLIPEELQRPFATVP